MESQLRNECQNLLSQLKESQKCMKEKILSSRHLNLNSSSLNVNHSNYYDENSSAKFGKDISGKVNIAKDAETDLKPTYARNKLLSLSKSSARESEIIYDMNTNNVKNKENEHTSHSSWSNEDQAHPDFNMVNSDRDHLHELRTDMTQQDYTVVNSLSSLPLSNSVVSPSRMRKRQLIDKHTSVDTKLNPTELKELDDERLLNFSYSHINVDKNYGIKSATFEDYENKREPDEEKDQTSDSTPRKADSHSHDFHTQLQDQGNDRRYNNFLKDASVKPKSLLNSTNYYSLSKKGNNSRVRFNESCNDDTPVVDQRLLGYDWIAALLDNEQNLMNQSESFFHDICDFRKAFKEECDNKFYMESPYTLVDKEPEPVVEALTEPKVRPFVVNERLFTEPLTSDLLEDCYGKDGKSLTSKEPTKENPRFVRVSIPRSTLQTPYRVKPHRRGSFDGSDSCSLADHCLLGWENTVPSMMPPAKSLSLADDAGTQINSQTTTLAEAERLALTHNQVQWHLSRPSAQVQTLPRWKKHYMDLTLNLSLPSNVQNRTANASSLNQSRAGSRCDIKRKTDKILQATYSTMYEMERLRQQRELEKYDNV